MKLLYDESYYDDVIWNPEEESYELERTVGNQTIWMQIGWVWSHEMSDFSDKLWWNVALSIYNKSKDMYSNMDDKKITGVNPIQNFIIARKMFDALEAAVVMDAVRNKRDIYIYTHWVDNRRRDAYYRVLSKKGYRYGRAPWTTKVIMKKFKWKDYKEMIENEEF